MSDASKKDGEGLLKDKRVRRAWSLYSWWGRLQNANRFVRFLVGLLQSKAGGTIAFSVVGGALTVGAVAVSKPDLLRGWLLQKTSVDVSTQKWADSSVVFPIDGFDKAGKRASFDVLVLTKDYTWVRGSSDTLAKGETNLNETDVAREIFTNDVKNGLGRSSDVIAVGVASQEGTAVAEKARASRRSEAAAKWLLTAMPPATRVWTLSLGQYHLACTIADIEDTSWQRPLMIIGVRWQDPGVNVGEALADAMTGKSNVPSPACYSDFALAKVR